VHRNDEYEEEVTAGREEIAAVLSGVADGILAGSVRVGTDAGAVTVDVPEELTLEIELETEGGERSLELELEWPAPDDASAASSDEVAPDETEREPALVGAADGSRSLARFEVYRGRDDEWRWRLRHRNGNIIATGGEGYTRKHNALKGLRSVMANSADAEITDELTN
jgi:amphi-Trp domain-containing protein